MALHICKIFTCQCIELYMALEFFVDFHLRWEMSIRKTSTKLMSVLGRAFYFIRQTISALFDTCAL